MITEVLLLRQGFRDIDNYQEIFTKEVKEKGIKFNAQEKEKFDDMALKFPLCFDSLSSTNCSFIYTNCT